MLDTTSNDRASVPTEHDYIGLSEVSSAAVKQSASSQEAEGALQDTDLRLELGLGLGLGTGFGKKEGEGESKELQASRQLERSHASSIFGLESTVTKKWMKRGFSETLATMPALKSTESDAVLPKQSSFKPIWAPSNPTVPAWHPNGLDSTLNKTSIKGTAHASADSYRNPVVDGAPPAKDRVVGWPPVRSYRRQTLAKPAEMFVKVNMDGITVGRKVDLNAYSSYESLLRALEELFQPSTSGSQAVSGRDHDMKHFLLASDSEFVLTYEDKDGDWMLVGDVPWSMFVSTVRRLRITRVSEATGSGTRALEKSRLHA